MTRCELDIVYRDLRPRMLTALRNLYGLSHESAEDVLHNIVVDLLKKPGMLEAMHRQQVEAFFQTKHVGRGKGLNWRVARFKAHEVSVQTWGTRWGNVYQKNVHEGGKKHEIIPRERILLVQPGRNNTSFRYGAVSAHTSI